MKVLLINTDPRSFLTQFYEGEPDLKDASYDNQLKARHATLFGVADFYSRNFRALGHMALEVYPNNDLMQSAWASEHGMSFSRRKAPIAGSASSFLKQVKRQLRPYKSVLSPLAKATGLMESLGKSAQSVLLAQVEEFAPDVIINQNILATDQNFAKQLRKNGRILIAQHGVDLPSGVDLSPYDAGVSMLDWVVEKFRAAGMHAEQIHLAFEPSVLDQFAPGRADDIDVSFVGSVGADHGERLRLLEQVAERYTISIWGPDVSELPPRSPLRKRYMGSVWGRNMFEILRASKITLNSHIGAARGMAGNMRLFEATGMGALLLTDNQKNLDTLFSPWAEVIPYTDAEDCVAKIGYYLNNECERLSISEAGKRRTLERHTYRNRVKALVALIDRIS